MTEYSLLVFIACDPDDVVAGRISVCSAHSITYHRTRPIADLASKLHALPLLHPVSGAALLNDEAQEVASLARVPYARERKWKGEAWLDRLPVAEAAKVLAATDAVVAAWKNTRADATTARFDACFDSAVDIDDVPKGDLGLLVEVQAVAHTTKLVDGLVVATTGKKPYPQWNAQDMDGGTMTYSSQALETCLKTE